MAKNPSTKSKVDPHSNQAATNLSYILNPLAALRAIWSPDNGLTTSQAVILSSLVIHADAEGKCWPSQKRIAACAKLKKVATNAALNGLEEKKLIQRTRRRFIGTHYQLIPSAIHSLGPSSLNEHGHVHLTNLPSSLNEHVPSSLNEHKLPMSELPNGTTQPLSPLPGHKGARGGGERAFQPKSKYSYEECVRYAENLKGIKYPEGFATTIHQTGEADQRIEKFLTAEVSKAEKQAKKETAKEAEQRAQLLWMVEQIKTNGGPKHDWERQILIAAKELV